MLFDVNAMDGDNEVSADVCIVGAGAAGIALAKELVGSHLRVCLLESGGFDPEPELQDLNRGSIQGRYYYDLRAGRMRAFGGTTNLWSGWSRPLDPIDFEARPFVPHSGWPITYDELLPFYQRAQEVLQLGDFAYAGHQYAEGIPDFFRSDQPAGKVSTRVWRRSPPTRFGEAYRATLVDAANVEVYLHATVIELQTDADARAVTQVLAGALNGKRLRVKARSTVLCTGGLEVPRLLLLANGVKPNGLGNDRDLVGRYFMLHPQIYVARLMIDTRRLGLLKTVVKKEGKDYLRGGLSVAEQVQRQEGLPNHAILFSTHQLKPLAGLKRKIVDGLTYDKSIESGIGRVMADVGGLTPDPAGQAEPTEDFSALNLDLRMDHLPNPDSRVMLGKQTDAFGKREILLDWKTSRADFDSVRRTVEILGETFGELGMGRLQIRKWLLAKEENWPDDSEWDFHHMGATRMSADPATGVVDAHCRVHGVDNLYVASSSVFTTAGFVNPTMTIVALALRLADHLKEKQVS